MATEQNSDLYLFAYQTPSLGMFLNNQKKSQTHPLTYNLCLFHVPCLCAGNQHLPRCPSQKPQNHPQVFFRHPQYVPFHSYQCSLCHGLSCPLTFTAVLVQLGCAQQIRTAPVMCQALSTLKAKQNRTGKKKKKTYAFSQGLSCSVVREICKHTIILQCYTSNNRPT